MFTFNPNIPRLLSKRDSKALIKALGHQEPTIRAASSRALGQLRDRDAQDALVKLLVVEEPVSVRDAAFEALVEIADQAYVKTVARALDQGTFFPREAVEQLSRTQNTWVIDLLVAFVQEQAPANRFLAPWASHVLAEIGDRRAVGYLVLELKDLNPNVRRGAAQALAHLGDAMAIDTLKVDLFAQNLDVRDASARALASLGWEPEDDTQRALIAVSLRNFEQASALGEVAIDPLLETIKSSTDFNRCRAATAALCRIKSERVLKPLAIMLQDVEGREGPSYAQYQWPRFYLGPRDSVIDDISGVLASSGNTWAIDRLAEIAASSFRDNVCLAAVRALESQAFVTHLARVLRASNPIAADAATQSLIRLGTDAAEPLVRILDDPGPDARLRAVHALVEIGWRPTTRRERALCAIAEQQWDSASGEGVAAIEPLTRVIEKDRELSVRLKAYSALMQITGSHPTIGLVKDIVETTAAEIRRLYSRTKSEQTGTKHETWRSATGEWDTETAVYEDRPDPDLTGIRKLVELLPMSLRAQVSVLAGEAANVM